MVNNGSNLFLGISVLAAAGVGLYLLIKQGKCEEGTTKTRTCPDDSVIITHTCVSGEWQETGNTCPEPVLQAEITNTEWLTVGGQAVARITVKNTGNTAFTGHIGFSIKPSNYTEYVDAPYRNVGVINPGDEKIFTSLGITIPGDAEGNVEGFVAIKYYDGNDYISLDEVQDPAAYVIELVCTEGEYRCSPTNPNVSQRCVSGGWINQQSCSVTCDPETGQCTSAPLKVLIAYASVDDQLAAGIIATDLQPYYDVTLKECASYYELEDYDAVVVVGGQYSWEQCTANLFNLLGFTPIDYTYSGGVYVQKVNLPVIAYAIAGWLPEDTERSAEYFSAQAIQVGIKNVASTL